MHFMGCWDREALRLGLNRLRLGVLDRHGLSLLVAFKQRLVLSLLTLILNAH